MCECVCVCGGGRGSGGGGGGGRGRGRWQRGIYLLHLSTYYGVQPNPISQYGKLKHMEHRIPGEPMRTKKFRPSISYDIQKHICKKARTQIRLRDRAIWSKPSLFAIELNVKHFSSEALYLTMTNFQTLIISKVTAFCAKRQSEAGFINVFTAIWQWKVLFYTFSNIFFYGNNEKFNCFDFLRYVLSLIFELCKI